MSDASHRNDAGYRLTPSGGARMRADIADVYVFRAHDGDPDSAEFLQLLRAGEPLGGTWQPVMGHIEAGERAVDCVLRELGEEVALAPGDPALLGLWALEQVHPFYVAAIDAVVLSPRFAARVAPTWSPRLNHEHTAARWVPLADVDRLFMWPGQKLSCAEIAREIIAPGSLAEPRLRVPLR